MYFRTGTLYRRYTIDGGLAFAFGMVRVSEYGESTQYE